MTHPPITQKEIARRLGVSQALVSRVLTDTSSRIRASAATVDRIREAAARWQYRPSVAARILKGAPTRTLGVIVKNFDDPFFGHMVADLLRLARTADYSLALAGWNREAPDETDLAPLRKFPLDGLIVCGSDFQPAEIDRVLRAGKPVVQIGGGPARPGVQQVIADVAGGLDQAVRYLHGLGHRAIAYFGEASTTSQRLERVLKADLVQRGLPVRPEWFLCLPPPLDEGRARIEGFLARRRGAAPTAVIAADDALALRVLRAFYDLGVRVPETLSLVGMDDIAAARTSIPALTTVRLPVSAMDETAFRLATAPEQRPEHGRPILVSPELVVRESCGPCRR